MTFFDLMHHLIGCDWGYTISTSDDDAPCLQRAARRFVLHDGDQEYEVQLCAEHGVRFEVETDPHKETDDAKR